MENIYKRLREVPWNQVKITGGFWKNRLEINEKVTLTAEYEQCKKTGRIDCVKALYRAGNNVIPRPHHYWDSDLAKWIEAASYSLYYKPDQLIEERIDSIVDDFEKLQMEDGYLNTYFTVSEPGKRWTNVYQMHELYCAGHLIEAAIAYQEASKKGKFLFIMCRYADHIEQVFGAEEGKIHGYPGHQEIELALVKLYRCTGYERYLKLAKYFLDERGKQPYFFEEEAHRNARDVEDGGPKGILGKNFLSQGPYALFQSHVPIRDQKTAEGHAVRVAYMGCGGADVAVETKDDSLYQAVETLWNNVTQKRMYVTGGIGAQDWCERFNFDYHLPNETAYNETCAAIGMVMWGKRMLQVKADRKYSDVMERALYNGVISGVSLTGDRFFYANHLASHPKIYEDRIVRNPRMFPERQTWFPVSCCPMNLARLTESLGGYVYSVDEEGLYIHHYIESDTNMEAAGQTITIRQHTKYPYEEMIQVEVEMAKPAQFTIAIRIPGWCKSANIQVGAETILVKDGAEAKGRVKNGYLYLNRFWKIKDEIQIILTMEPFLLEAHPEVRMDCGKAAIQCGPIIYCLEQADNGADIFDLVLTKDSHMTKCFKPDLLHGVTVISGTAYRRNKATWVEELYRPIETEYEQVSFLAVPYYSWSNRESGEMTVWIGYQSRIEIESGKGNE